MGCLASKNIKKEDKYMSSDQKLSDSGIMNDKKQNYFIDTIKQMNYNQSCKISSSQKIKKLQIDDLILEKPSQEQKSSQLQCEIKFTNIRKAQFEKKQELQQKEQHRSIVDVKNYFAQLQTSEQPYNALNKFVKKRIEIPVT